MADLTCAPAAIVKYLFWWREFEPWIHFKGKKSSLYREICHSLTDLAAYEAKKMYWIIRVRSFFDKINLT